MPGMKVCVWHIMQLTHNSRHHLTQAPTFAEEDIMAKWADVGFGFMKPAFEGLGASFGFLIFQKASFGFGFAGMEIIDCPPVRDR